MTDELIGKTLGPYQIVERIGRGGMATVYKAYQPALDRMVAIKVLPAHLAEAAGFTQRFQREARAVARLEHPNILAVHDFGQQDDLSYLVMRYVEGGTLKDLLGKPLPLERVAELISQIADALDYAHERGVVHRDVKPGNVLLDLQGRALLTDFGVARIVEETQKITGTGVGVGTPAYMSPEQGKGRKVDRRSDVYSLGVVLYEMVTGEVPYQAETPIAVVLKHINDPLPMPRQANPAIPETVERVVLKALAKEPQDRFHTAGEMARALREARPEPEPDQARRRANLARDAAAVPRRMGIARRRFATIGVLASVSLLVVAAAFLAGYQQVERANEVGSGALTTTGLPVSLPMPSPRTPSPTDVPPATVIPSTPEGPAQAVAPPKPGKLLFEEDFDDNRNFWLLNNEHYLERGEYHISATGPGAFEIGTAPQFANFILEVGARKVDGLYGEGWGIGFRVSEDLQRSYLVSIGGQGEVALFETFPGRWEEIAPFPIISDTVLKGNASNKLTILAEGPVIDLYINDKFVGEAIDDALASGTIQVFNGAVVHVAFDYLRVYELGD